MDEVREITELFRLEKVLKSSPSGVVFRAQYPRTGTRVAIKLVNRGSSPDQEACQKGFLGAARLVKEIAPPAFPEILDFGLTPDGTAFMVLEYLDGRGIDTLAGWPAASLLPLFDPVADSLERLARSGLAHLNLAPENLVVIGESEAPSIRVLGFGSAAFRPEGSGLGLGAPAGGGAFAAPETVGTLEGTADWRADVYSLAQVLAYLLGAKVVQSGMPDPAIELAPGTVEGLRDAESLVALLQRCLRQLPGQRPASFGEVRQGMAMALYGPVGEHAGEEKTRAIRIPPAVPPPPVLTEPGDVGPVPAHDDLAASPDFETQAVPRERIEKTLAMSLREQGLVPPPETAAQPEAAGGTADEAPEPSLEAQEGLAAAPSEPTVMLGPSELPSVPHLAFGEPDAPKAEAPGEEAEARTIRIEAAAIPAATAELGVTPAEAAPAAPPSVPESGIPEAGPPPLIQPEPPPPAPAPAVQPQVVPPVPGPAATGGPRESEFTRTAATELAPPSLPPAAAQPEPIQPPPPAVAPAAPAARAGARAQRPHSRRAWPFVLIGVAGLAALIVVGGLIASRLLKREAAPLVAVPTPAPIRPTAVPAPTQVPRAAALLKEAEEALAAGKADEAREAADSMTPEEESSLTYEEAQRLKVVRDTLLQQRRGSLARSLERGLSQGNLELLRRTVAGITPEEEAELKAEPRVEARLNTARQAVAQHADLQKAFRERRYLDAVQIATALLSSVPKASAAADIRERAAAVIEAEAEAAVSTAEFEAGIGRYQELQRAWPDRPGLAGKIDRARAEMKVEQKLAAVLGEAERAGRENRPEKGLEALAGAAPTARWEARFRQVRDSLTAQLADLDAKAPTIQVRPGFKLEYEKGKGTTIPVRVSDDYMVKSVSAYGRVEGTASFEQLPAKPGAGGEWAIDVAATFHRNETVEFYVTAGDHSGHAGQLGSKEAPLKLKRKRWLF
jgi:serine/threonine-protein kinase